MLVGKDNDRPIVYRVLSLTVFLCGLAHLCQASEARFYVGEVRFTGNRTFSRKVLLRQMLMQPSGFLNRVPFSRSALDDDVKMLQAFYRDRGFLDAEIELEEASFDSARKRVDIAIRVQEGPRTIVAGLAVFGNQVFPDSVILGLLKTRVGQPLLADRIDQDVRSVMNHLAERGYLDARVSPELRVDRENHRAFVELSVSEGVQVRVAGVRIIGAQKVKPKVIMRELRFKQGQVLRMSAVRESIRRLYRTGLFRFVEIAPVQRDSLAAERVVEVKVGELAFGQIEGGIGYGTFDRLRASLECSYGNLFGLGQKLALRGRLSFVTQKGELAFSDPWAFGLPTQFDASGYYEHHDEPSYRAAFRGLRFTFGTQGWRRHMFRLSLRDEKVTWFRLLGSPPRNVRAKNTRSLTVSYSFDVRNDLFNPTKGTYFLAQTEVAGLGGPGTNQFVKVTLDWRGYRPWQAGSQLSCAVRVGWVQEFGQSTEVPVQERLFAGGARTLRGFQEKKAGPLTPDGIPIGGRFSLVFNFVEWRFPLYKMLAGAAFLEAGNVWPHARQASLSQLRWVGGVGLRVNTPIGVLRLDFGLKLDRRPEEPRGAIQIDMGQAF